MKFLAILSAAVLIGLTFTASDAEAAKRLGSGKSSGMQRESVSAQKSATPAPAAPQQATAANPANPAAAPAQPKRSWMGPLAGLAAGLGLAALASHFGFGQELASMLMIGLLVMAVLFVIGFIMRKRAATAQPELATAGGAPYAPAQFERSNPAGDPTMPASGASALSGGTTSRHIPADFDVDGFVRNAKVNFIRLQAANDAGNLGDIRQFTTPEMFGEFKLAMVERGTASQTTDVIRVDAEVLDVAEESERYVASVRFTGQIREDAAAPEAFDEIWHMVKPRNGSHGWVLAGIQQVQ